MGECVCSRRMVVVGPKFDSVERMERQDKKNWLAAPQLYASIAASVPVPRTASNYLTPIERTKCEHRRSAVIDLISVGS